jgi:predicted deacylase
VSQYRDIESFTYGTGTKHVVFVGGIHGGYEWNSVLLAYTFMDFLKTNPSAVPANVSITVIPNANPDAVYKAIGKEGRFALSDVAERRSLRRAISMPIASISTAISIASGNRKVPGKIKR